MLSSADSPVKVAQDGAVAIAYGDVVKTDDFGSIGVLTKVDDICDIVRDILAARDDDIDM